MVAGRGFFSFLNCKGVGVEKSGGGRCEVVLACLWMVSDG